MTATPLPLSTVVELPPETSGALTFHLPLEVFALQAAGAAPDVIDARISARLADAYHDGLVDPPLYRWAVDHYRPFATRLLDAAPAARADAIRSILPLGDGLVGAAFHGMIRLGYGAMRRDAEEIARGLAYLRTRRQVLHGPGAQAGTDQLPSVAMPSPAELEGSTVFDQLSLAAGAGGHDELTDPARPLFPAAALAARAAELIRHDAGSFVSVHSMTGLHGLAEFHTLVIGSPPGADLDGTVLAPWWRAYSIGLQACTIVVSATTVVGRTECAPVFTDTEALVAAAVASGDTHSVKLVVAMRRLAEFGVLDEPTMWELGAIKLGVDECRL